MNLNQNILETSDPFTAIDLKDRLENIVNNAIESLSVSNSIGKIFKEKIQKRLKPFLINYIGENIDFSTSISELKCLNVIDDKLFMTRITIDNIDKYLIAWHNNQNQPRISVFTDSAIANDNMNKLKNGIFILE